MRVMSDSFLRPSVLSTANSYLRSSMSVYIRENMRMKLRKQMKKMTVMSTLFSMFSMTRCLSIYDMIGVSLCKLD